MKFFKKVSLVTVVESAAPTAGVVVVWLYEEFN
jgi:hypothetical protein